MGRHSEPEKILTDKERAEINLQYMMSGPMPAPTPEVGTTAPAERALMELNAAVGRINSKVQTLVSKIEPVLSGDVPQKPTTEQAFVPLGTSTVVSGITDNILELHRLADYVNTILARVEV